ncbi:hypothetical protein D3C85_667100 [compost metagenome]
MRYININDIELPEGWEETVVALNVRLNNAQSLEERKTIIKENQIWKNLFIPLHNLSNGKCWYSEALEVMSDRDVDHFRPKGKARNIDKIPRADEEGYWWLAFDYENFRFSSQYSNQIRKDKFAKKKAAGGKGVFFPLFENSIVAKTKVRCQDEEIMLLDPCDEDDPSLITFDSTGAAIPNVKALLDDNDRIRVETSIKLYHLDHGPLVDLREKLWARCQRKIDEIRAISNDPAGVSNFGKNRVRFLRQEIRSITERSEEFSAVAIACCEENGLSFITARR